MTDRTTVRLPDELLRRAKRRAATEGRTLTSLIEEGLRLVTAERRVPRQDGRVLPPVSRCTGGLVPGIDLARPSALEELEDLERFDRLKRS